MSRGAGMNLDELYCMQHDAAVKDLEHASGQQQSA
jgi:hypothetical protein